MNIVIHPVHFDASSQLVDFIKRKLQKLETFFDKIVGAEVFLKLDSNQNIKDKIVEIKVQLPGKTVFVAEVGKTFEECTDLAVDSVARQVKKHKEKIKSHSASVEHIPLEAEHLEE